MKHRLIVGVSVAWVLSSTVPVKAGQVSPPASSGSTELRSVEVGQPSLRVSVARAMVALAQAPPVTPARGTSRRGMLWGGIALTAAGATLAVLSTTALKSETCGVVSDLFLVVAGCIEETNRGLLWTGVGLAGGGAVVAILGARPMLKPGAVGLSATVRF